MKTFLIPLLLSTLGWFYLGTIPVSLLNDPDPIVQERLIQKFGELIEEKKSDCQKVELEFIENEENKNIVDVVAFCYEWGI